jgi:peptidoglycan-N-acetylglucosamine deacetylase
VTRRFWAPVIGLVVFAGVAYGAYRLYLRSLPPPPAVVLHDADLDRALGLPAGERLQRVLLGRRGVAGPKLVALTFDDGPYPVATPELLAILDAVHVRATFFLIGRDAEQYPGLVRAIAAAGHELGDHTQTHPDLDRLSDAAVTSELRAGAATLARIADQPTIHRLFRPPHGRYTRATLRAAQAAGFDTILWTDDPGDWRNVPAADLAAHVARFATSPEILLLHNGRDATMAMLHGVVERYRRAGYTFVTVGELLGRVTPEQLDRAARTPLPAAR